MAEQELMFKAALLERQAEELNSNVSYIANQIAELEQFKETLKSIGDSKTKEVLSSLGKGVYVKTSMEDKNLLVSIGANVVIKKSPEQTIKTLDAQIRALHEAKAHFMNQVEICNSEIQSAISEIQQARKDQK